MAGHALKAYLTWSAIVLSLAYLVPYLSIVRGALNLYLFWGILTLIHYLVTVAYVRGWVRNE
jgi:hypothetical protein